MCLRPEMEGRDGGTPEAQRPASFVYTMTNAVELTSHMWKMRTHPIDFHMYALAHVCLRLHTYHVYTSHIHMQAPLTKDFMYKNVQKNLNSIVL